jgi:hypothetical protein
VARVTAISQPRREVLLRDTQDASRATGKRHHVSVGKEWFAYEAGQLVEYRRGGQPVRERGNRV